MSQNKTASNKDDRQYFETVMQPVLDDCLIGDYARKVLYKIQAHFEIYSFKKEDSEAYVHQEAIKLPSVAQEYNQFKLLKYWNQFTPEEKSQVKTETIFTSRLNHILRSGINDKTPCQVIKAYQDFASQSNLPQYQKIADSIKSDLEGIMSFDC